MILAIDTAGSPSQVVFLSADKKTILDRKIWHQKHSQSEKTLKYIDRLVDNNGFKLSQIDKIYVNIGPKHESCGKFEEASFTGLKIGVTVANSLGFALKKEVIGVSLDSRSFLETVREVSGSKNRFVFPNYPKPPNISKKNNK
jgi:tRNA A37 threonylcarbamoyladenosine modification protein TsaB